MKASIGIITCNRPQGLKRLIDSLNDQKVSPDTELEILIVDNDCNQETKDIVTKARKNHKSTLNYFEEPERGIVAARNKCVEQFLTSGSDFLIFIDDDEWPEKPSWAQDLLDAQKKHNADIVTSHVISVGEPGTPSWATQLLYGDNKLVEGQTVTKFYTNNLLISRKILEKISPAFDLRFAMTGSSDYHFSLKCKNADFVACYTSAPVIEEFPKSRATITWFAKRGYRSGAGFTRSHLIEDNLIHAIPFCLFMAITRFIRGVILSLYGVITIKKLRFIDGIFRLSSFLGSIAAFLGLQYSEYKTIHGK